MNPVHRHALSLLLLTGCTRPNPGFASEGGLSGSADSGAVSTSTTSDPPPTTTDPTTGDPTAGDPTAGPTATSDVSATSTSATTTTTTSSSDSTSTTDSSSTTSTTSGEGSSTGGIDACPLLVDPVPSVSVKQGIPILDVITCKTLAGKTLRGIVSSIGNGLHLEQTPNCKSLNPAFLPLDFIGFTVPPGTLLPECVDLTYTRHADDACHAATLLIHPPEMPAEIKLEAQFGVIQQNTLPFAIGVGPDPLTCGLQGSCKHATITSPGTYSRTLDGLVVAEHGTHKSPPYTFVNLNSHAHEDCTGNASYPWLHFDWIIAYTP